MTNTHSPMLDTMGIPLRQKSPLDRLLSLITEVRGGEGVSVLLLALNIFLLFVFYSVLKIIRDALILSEGGAELGSYAAAGQAAVLLAVVPAYGAFASRVNRIRLVCGVTLFFASHLIIFWALGLAGVHIGIAFYIWAGVFNVVVIAQLWAFANDIYTRNRGKRLFPLINLGASLGAVIGAAFTTLALANAGAFELMLVAAAGIAVTIGLTIWVNTRERSAGRDAAGENADKPLGKAGGFKLVLSDRYLLLIALLIVVLNMVNTLGGYLLNTLIRAEAINAIVPGAVNTANFTVEQTAAMRGAIGTMSGTVQTAVNIVSFLFGAFLVSRVLKWIGVRGALFVLPLVALASYSLIAFIPIFSIVRIAKVLENSCDYSINNTARHALFLPTSREAKYKAKQAIDTFFWRAGDMIQAAIVFAGLRMSLGLRGFAAINIVFVCIWLVLVVAIGREHKRLTDGADWQRVA
jgi:AAA family ATP:ADP antiporter